MTISKHVGQSAARWLMISAMTAALAACGGGSGDGETTDGDVLEPGDGSNILFPTPDDRDGDGIPNAEDPDFDASDLDGDGIQNNRDPDIDGDGFLNGEDDDIDGDGILNAEDADADGDGFEEPTADDVCGSAGGTDADSSNFTWNDNCTVRRDNQFADSLYAAGIQRIVYCLGFGTASSVDAFTDGEFGPGTEAAVTAYQTAYNEANPDNVIGVDGQVGPQTWAVLQGELDLVEPGTPIDGYGVQGERCGDAVLFLNTVTIAEDGLSVDRGGWQLTQGSTNTTPVPFSVAEPFGIID